MAAQVDRHEAYLDKSRAELSWLAEAGIRATGNAFSPVLAVKAETSGAPLSGSDGTALRAALGALGYAPEDWAAISTLDDEGNVLAPDILRRAVVALDPDTLVVCDERAASSIRDAFSDELAGLEEFDAAMLAPGILAHVLGMRVLNLDGFEESLADEGEKRLRWRWLKQLRPLGEPF